MIETRGENKIFVTSKSAIPISDICEAILTIQNYDELSKNFPVTIEEVFECIQFFLELPENRLMPEKNFVKFAFDVQESTFHIMSLTDIMFLHLILHARTIATNETNFETLCLIGINHIVVRCLVDTCSGENTFNHDPLHCIIFESMTNKIGSTANWNKILEATNKKLDAIRKKK